jgi:hypothetical protein
MEYTYAGEMGRVVPATTVSAIVAPSCPSAKDSLPDFCPSGKDKFQRGCYQIVSINPLDTILASEESSCLRIPYLSKSVAQGLNLRLDSLKLLLGIAQVLNFQMLRSLGRAFRV